MSVMKRSFLYIKRKKSKSVLLFIVLFVICTAMLSGITIKKATQASRENINKSVNASFIVESDLRNNMGEGDRGFGNIPENMINEISKVNQIRDYNATLIGESRINQLNKVELSEPRMRYNEEQEKFLKHHYDFEGTRKSELDHKFISGLLELSQGRHLTEDDVNKVLVHEDFAALNGLKLNDKFDYSNVSKNQAQEKSGTVEIVGLFKGTNKEKATHNIELFENIILSDVKTAADLRGFDKEVLYQTGTFYINDPKEIETVIKAVSELDVEWHGFLLSKADKSYSGLMTSIDSMDNLVNKLIIGVFVMSVLILSVMLWFWINARIHEIGVLMSLGISKINIVSQFLLEIVIIATFSFFLSFFASDKIAQNISNTMINQAQEMTQTEQRKELGGLNIGYDANTAVSTKPIDSLDVTVSKRELVDLALVGLLIIFISVSTASINIVRLKPKEILSKMS